MYEKVTYKQQYTEHIWIVLSHFCYDLGALVPLFTKWMKMFPVEVSTLSSRITWFCDYLNDL